MKTRKQFDQPIAMFQAVGHRAADAYIDAETVRLTAQQAVWRIAEGRASESQVAVAKFFASEAGNRVLLAAQHLHGGVGVDRDYPPASLLSLCQAVGVDTRRGDGTTARARAHARGGFHHLLERSGAWPGLSGFGATLG